MRVATVIAASASAASAFKSAIASAMAAAAASAAAAFSSAALILVSSSAFALATTAVASLAIKKRTCSSISAFTAAVSRATIGAADEGEEEDGIAAAMASPLVRSARRNGSCRQGSSAVVFAKRLFLPFSSSPPLPLLLLLSSSAAAAVDEVAMDGECDNEDDVGGEEDDVDASPRVKAFRSVAAANLLSSGVRNLVSVSAFPSASSIVGVIT